jgi:purine-binding chemotaxis protein CheW
MPIERQFCTFLIDDLLLGVRIEEVQELIRHQPTTTVPLASSELGGLINLRGQIVIAIDLRRRLGLEPRCDRESSMNVILRTADGLVSLLVDEIGDVVEVSEDELRLPPETLVACGKELIRSVVMLEKSLLLILDTEKAVTVDSTVMNPKTGD